jgi:hypothetical protein
MLGSDTIQARAATSEQQFEAAQQTRQRVADRFDTQGVTDVDVRRQGRRDVGASQAFFERAEPVEAAAQLDPQYEAVAVDRGDVRRQQGGGFGVREGVRREQRTADFEQQFDVFGVGELDRNDDLRELDGGGFGLGRDATREVGAARIDDRLPGVDVGPEDVTLTETESGAFDVGFEGRF